MGAGVRRPKSKMSDATSKYSAVVFTVPVEKQKKEQPQLASEEEDEEYEDDFDDFEPYETSNEDQRTDMNGKSNTSAIVTKEEPLPVSSQVDQHNQSAVNIEIQQQETQDASARSQEARQ